VDFGKQLSNTSGAVFLQSCGKLFVLEPFALRFSVLDTFYGLAVNLLSHFSKALFHMVADPQAGVKVLCFCDTHGLNIPSRKM
jgi:hypothetical protein